MMNPNSGWCGACQVEVLKDGVADGTRTRDNQNHNLGLYQLSYDHHPAGKLG
jgi:integrase